MPKLLDPLVDLVLPRRCVGCRRPGAALCPVCLAPVLAGGPAGAAGPGGLVQVDCGALGVLAAIDYGGPVRQALLAYKERGRRDLADPLGRALALAVAGTLGQARASPRDVVLVCVPSTRTAVAARGGDHVLRLARRAAALTAVRVAPGALRLQRAVRDSAGLGVDERARNLAGAMAAIGPQNAVGGSRVRRRAIVVDDIVTTGATMTEAERALRWAGWQVLGGAAVAATRKRLDG